MCHLRGRTPLNEPDLNFKIPMSSQTKVNKLLNLWKLKSIILHFLMWKEGKQNWKCSQMLLDKVKSKLLKRYLQVIEMKNDTSTNLGKDHN